MAITKISSALIGANTIATSNIADNAVDGTKIAQNSILTKHIDDAQITTGHIVDDAVTLAKMDGLARGKIIYGDASGNPAALALGSNGTVLKSDGTDIAWGTDATVAALTSEEVQDIAGAMFSSNTETGIAATYEDGDGTIDLVIGANVIVGGMIAQNSILTRHIDDNQVTADQIAASTITTTQIAANTIATGNVADNAIDGTKIASNSILTRHIDDNQVTADQIAAATITTTQIAANTIATGNVADNAIDGTKIASNSILTRHIDDDQITGAQLADNIDIVGTLDVTGATTLDNTLSVGEAATFTEAVIASKSARITQVAITSGSGAVAWDANAAANAYHVTTENTTFSAPGNAVEGAVISVEIAQGGTARTIAWNTVFEFAASTAPTVTATANKTDIFTFRYNGSVWQEIGRVQNMAQT